MSRRGFFLWNGLKWVTGTALKCVGVVAAATHNPLWGVGSFVAGELLHALKLD